MEENKNTGSMKITIVKLCSILMPIWFTLTTIVCILVLLFGGASFGAGTDFCETMGEMFARLMNSAASADGMRFLCTVIFRFMFWGAIIIVLIALIVIFLIGLIKYIILLTKKDESGMRTGIKKFYEYFIGIPMLAIGYMLFFSLISNRNPYGIFSFLLVLLMIIPMQLVYKILTEYVFKPDEWIVYEKYYGKGKAIGEIVLSTLYNFLRLIIFTVACILLCREAVAKHLLENIPYLFDKYEANKIFYLGALLNALFAILLVKSFYKIDIFLINKNTFTEYDTEDQWKKFMIWSIVGTIVGIGVSIFCESYEIGEILIYLLPILIVAILGFVTFKLPTLSRISAKKKAIENMESKKAEIAASLSSEQEKTE